MGKAALLAGAGLMIALGAGAQAGGTGTADAAASGKRPMTFDDMMKMRRLGDIDVSKDGQWVLFSATDVDLAKNTRTPHLWVVRVNGSAPETALTSALAGESRGRFSPDGKQILFETARDDGQQIWLADFDGNAGTIGEPRELTHVSTEADNATWSPDGKYILFTSAVYPECSAGTGPGIAPAAADEDACDKRKDDELAASKVKAKIFTHLLYRHWNHFTDDKRSHLFLASVADGSWRDLNPGDPHDVPPFSLGEPDGWDFSPDGREITYEEKKVDDPALSTSVALYTLQLFDADGNAVKDAQPVKISTSAGGNFTPRYSPDGQWIAWRSQARAGYESDRFRLVVYDRVAGSKLAGQRVSGPAGGSAIREVLPNFDRWVDEEAWGPDSKTIYFAAGDEGEEPVFEIGIKDGNLSRFATLNQGAGVYGDLHVLGDNQTVVATRVTAAQPGEVITLGPSPAIIDPQVSKKGTALLRANGSPYPKARRQLTHLNSSLLAPLDLGELESFWFPSIGNVKVEGFLVRPPNFDATKKYPVKFLIHGGPQGEWGDSWSYRWNPELFAANGYVVVMINPGGSVGYGQAFVDRVNGDWGGRPFIDLMRGLDYAEQHYPFIDRNRECALGASYGGYMADWILGHTDRFKCIVSHDGMFNAESAYGTTDELWFNEWEFKGTPWTNPALYKRWSPMGAETHFKTPTLVVHSQLDYRLDVSEGYQLFDTLQRMGVPSKMLYFPDEGHWVNKPQNSQLWYKTVNDWVDQWTKQ
ncbi:MAG TPA: S9 family peptidase [Acidobacteriaceae bacterium]|jgi:dipeptidyl aminopeptidase/acylaminoacyl peptidase|nr:S9 family peptidase [Acidobacteriaceae bacterium]